MIIYNLSIVMFVFSQALLGVFVTFNLSKVNHALELAASQDEREEESKRDLVLFLL